MNDWRGTETWPQTILAAVCFAGLLTVIFALVYVFGPEMVR